MFCAQIRGGIRGKTVGFRGIFSEGLKVERGDV
jgi:hypothetical protein